MLLERQKQEILEAELEAQEKLLWSGQPNPLRATRQTIPVFIFGVAWTAFTINFIHLWWQGSRPSASFWGFSGIGFDLFMVPFLLIGIGLVLSPYWAYLQSAKTVYGITNKRVIIIAGGKSRQVESYGRTELGTIKRIERADRTGDLIFAQKLYKDGDGDRQTKDIQFIGISEVREVEILLREALTVGA